MFQDSRIGRSRVIRESPGSAFEVVSEAARDEQQAGEHKHVGVEAPLQIARARSAAEYGLVPANAAGKRRRLTARSRDGLGLSPELPALLEADEPFLAGRVVDLTPAHVDTMWTEPSVDAASEMEKAPH